MYIKRDDMMDILWKHAEEMSDILCDELTHNIPSADVVERKRGEWEETYDHSRLAPIRRYKCSVCGEEWIPEYIKRFNFCPNCGADMREREDE